jgi:hypothetical protein
MRRLQTTVRFEASTPNGWRSAMEAYLRFALKIRFEDAFELVVWSGKCGALA